MKIDNLNTEEIRFGVLSFENYQTPYLSTSYDMLNITFQGFRNYLDTIPKVEEMIMNTQLLIRNEKKGNCIGENEQIITYKNQFIEFYSVTIDDDICLRIRDTIWLEILYKLHAFLLFVTDNTIEINFR